MKKKFFIALTVIMLMLAMATTALAYTTILDATPNAKNTDVKDYIQGTYAKLSIDANSSKATNTSKNTYSQQRVLGVGVREIQFGVITRNTATTESVKSGATVTKSVTRDKTQSGYVYRFETDCYIVSTIVNGNLNSDSLAQILQYDVVQ